jgi:hypothetical protein
MTVMAISALGFSASTFSVQAGYTASAEAIAEDEEQHVESATGQKAASGDISDHLSVSAKQLLKRLAELQAQLRDLRSKMQAAENASYSNLAAKTSVVASFQSQISAITGTILLLSASLLKELDRSGGLNITA